MSLTFRTIYRNYHYLHLTPPVKWNIGRNCPLRVSASGISYQRHLFQPSSKEKEFDPLWMPIRQFSTQTDNAPKPKEPEKKQGLVQRFKQMYRDYWYVLVPVHMVTSAVWFGGFYYLVRSGVDILGLLQSLGVSETLIAPLKDSSAGFFALAFALYKIAAPLRYAVTVGGTTFAIRRLTAIGWIKPVPSTERIKEILQEKKDGLQDRIKESKEHYQVQMKEKHTQVMDEMRRYKTQMRDMKNKVKKM